MKIIPTLFLIGFAAATAQSQVQFQGNEFDLKTALATLPRMVTLEGRAEIRTNANRARINLLVTTEKRSLDDSLSENEAKRSALVAALKGQGFAADQIQNSDFASTQSRGIFTDKVRSYKIENRLVVTVLSPEQFREFARQADRHPEAVVQSLKFDHTDEKALQRKAVEEALADAKLQKAVYEKALGIRLTPRGFIEEKEVPSLAPVIVVGSQIPVGSSSSQRRSSEASTPSPEQPGPDFEFGEQLYKARVTVQYLVEPAQ